MVIRQLIARWRHWQQNRPRSSLLRLSKPWHFVLFYTSGIAAAYAGHSCVHSILKPDLVREIDVQAPAA